MTKTKTMIASALAAAALPAPALAIGNPASVFCGRMGGRTVIATLPSGDQIGLCYLPNRRIVEEWTLYRMFDGRAPSAARNPFLKP